VLHTGFFATDQSNLLRLQGVTQDLVDDVLLRDVDWHTPDHDGVAGRVGVPIRFPVTFIIISVAGAVTVTVTSSVVPRP